MVGTACRSDVIGRRKSHDEERVNRAEMGSEDRGTGGEKAVRDFREGLQD
jgi:hypothetical protein